MNNETLTVAQSNRVSQVRTVREKEAFCAMLGQSDIGQLKQKKSPATKLQVAHLKEKHIKKKTSILKGRYKGGGAITTFPVERAREKSMVGYGEGGRERMGYRQDTVGERGGGKKRPPKERDRGMSSRSDQSRARCEACRSRGVEMVTKKIEK